VCVIVAIFFSHCNVIVLLSWSGLNQLVYCLGNYDFDHNMKLVYFFVFIHMSDFIFDIFSFLNFLSLFVGPAAKKPWGTPKEKRSLVKKEGKIFYRNQVCFLCYMHLILQTFVWQDITQASKMFVHDILVPIQSKLDHEKNILLWWHGTSGFTRKGTLHVC
jgi:hypothetical protein